jgi:hypothetical protein
LNGNLTDRTGPRNQLRAPGIYNVDLSLNKFFSLGERRKIEFRTEFYNLFNRTHFGIPVHQLAFGNAFPNTSGSEPNPIDPSNPKGPKQFVETRLSPFTVQFALKFRF